MPFLKRKPFNLRSLAAEVRGLRPFRPAADLLPNGWRAAAPVLQPQPGPLSVSSFVDMHGATKNHRKNLMPAYMVAIPTYSNLTKH